ncbi:MAG: xylulokinase, partial [Solirubrobacteraceae bacterium]|nr:xylulokinase [Solirubrobacteraceae bacterium]
MTLLGIDVGTGGTRAVVVGDDGHVVASATEDHEPFASRHSGWAEQDPGDWWRACAVAVRAALEATGAQAGAIAAVGLSGQMHGAVLLGERD